MTILDAKESLSRTNKQDLSRQNTILEGRIESSFFVLITGGEQSWTEDKTKKIKWNNEKLVKNEEMLGVP